MRRGEPIGTSDGEDLATGVAGVTGGTGRIDSRGKKAVGLPGVGGRLANGIGGRGGTIGGAIRVNDGVNATVRRGE